MQQKLLSTLFLFFVFVSSFAQEKCIENALFELPDVVFKKINNKGNFESTYELKIKQPLDHQNPDKGYFYQRAFLSHKDFTQPMVMYISGYNQGGVYLSEVTNILDANQLSIEHRFFGESIPDSLDYDYLNLEQATADLHHINTIFKKLYKSKWVSTGISKGGATTIFYKYFFPEDVDAGVPYVAPINKEFEEHRIYTFLDTVGTDACREKLFKLQKRLFKHRDEVLPLIEMYSKGAKLKFDYLTLEGAFEYWVLEYPFAFWQFGASCEDIPTESTSLIDAVSYVLNLSDISFFSDKEIDMYLPHYYQSAEQMGYYGYETEKFKDDLKVLALKPHPHAAIVPDGIPVEFDGSLLKKINKWTQEEGDHLIYIYGNSDTWTASSVAPSKKVDAVWFFMAGKNHGSARYRQMTPQEKKKFNDTLERWLSIEIE